MIRRPVVSGKFYADNEEELKSQIRNCFFHPVGPGSLPHGWEKNEGPIGLIVPHAGYMASGPVAAWSYWKAGALVKPSTILIVGPNHTGLGTKLSLWLEGAWETPLGSVEIDHDFGRSLMAESNGMIMPDTSAHLYEHSIEVQLPFLQFLYSDFKIVPLIMTDQRVEVALSLSEIIKKELMGRNDVLVIASSDLNHYEAHEVTMEKDNQLLSLILDGKYRESYELSQEKRITACGLGPIVAVRNSFESMEVLCSTTSGEVMGDRYRTVGYVAALLS